MTFPTFQEAQLVRWFGAAAFVKGLDYTSHVRRVADALGVLEAEVGGSQAKPYAVRVEVRPGKPDAAPRSRCTCPVGGDCKHVVAALLVWSMQQAPAPAAPTAPTTRALPDPVQDWLRDLEGLRASADAPAKAIPSARVQRETLVYVLDGFHPGIHSVQLYKARLARSGDIADGGREWNNIEAALLKPPQFVQDADLAILRLLWLCRARYHLGGHLLEGAAGAEAVRRMVETGRAFALDNGRYGLGFGTRQPLSLGPARSATIAWREFDGSRIAPVLDAGLAHPAWLALQPWWYVDMSTGVAGPLELPCDGPLLNRLLTVPPITLDALPALREAFGRRLPGLPAPPVLAVDQARLVAGAPAPVLRLATRHAQSFGRAPWLSEDRIDFASVSFDYQGTLVGQAPSPELLRNADGVLIRLRRDSAAERAWVAGLETMGLRLLPLPLYHLEVHPPLEPPVFTLARAADWPHFMLSAVPALREQGWRIVMSDDFRHHASLVVEIEGSVREDSAGWFDLELGVRVDGQVLRLEPLLEALFARDLRWLDGGLDAIPDSEVLALHSADHGRLLLPASRLKPLVRALIDLFQAGEGLRVPRWDSGRLALLEDTGRWQFQGEGALRTLAERLRASPGVLPVATPAGLRTTLRPYQCEGLAWMQFLRSQDLGGVLADDMGLGKTVQTLAHLLVEHDAGRLDRPALILMPTSLIGNWKSEAQRFAPGLRVLDLHGPQRHGRFALMAQHDLVLSTYPLAWRDQQALAAQEWHLLILDEAQQVKNASSRAAAAIRTLRARHRLCLTGTPLENHLGELWSQFDFLLPGFLGSQRDFTLRWRNPIEKARDGVRAQLLARRVRPFMLRRRKSDVAAELPPKVEMLRVVEFDDAQRDLYETVRTAMQTQVLAAVQRQGLARSQIAVLDALLKLRQVCCDPRLVAMPAARQVSASAKLELLLEMVPELVEEGRRILLFSQFTSMLALIARALDEAGIAYVTLTGDTVDRETPVATFQSGAVPVFLISLRAGGVGLNLTAADTVIHYDPWWNPAVEQQATDRAHRIGQTSTVFVYKLIAAGTVEEKIQAMQQRKSALVGAILGDGDPQAKRFSDADLTELFAPLPELPGRE